MDEFYDFYSAGKPGELNTADKENSVFLRHFSSLTSLGNHLKSETSYTL